MAQRRRVGTNVQTTAGIQAWAESLGAVIGRGVAASVEDLVRQQQEAGPAEARAVRRKAARGRRTRREAQGPTTALPEVGATVRYRQGRGEFEAKVVRVDARAGVVTLERVSDGKRVTRPLEKLYR